MGGKAIMLVCAFFPFLNRIKAGQKSHQNPPNLNFTLFGANFFGLHISLNPKQGEMKLSSSTAGSEDIEQINANSPILRSTELKQAHGF